MAKLLIKAGADLEAADIVCLAYLAIKPSLSQAHRTPNRYPSPNPSHNQTRYTLL